MLEYLRPHAKQLLSSADEDDLFNVANNFTVRHLNQRQKSGFDKAIWYDWMFYTYLGTVRTILRIIDERGTGALGA